MIPLGLRLAVAGGRRGLSRLVLIVVAVSLGAALLLCTLAGIRAVDAQNQRYAWLRTGFAAADATARTDPAASGADPLWWLLRADQYDGERIGRVDVAATGPDSPVPPGVDRLPSPGEMYASPALARLLAATPAAELADRYGATVVGTIGDAALPAPDSLIAVVGRAVDDLASHGRAVRVTAISTTSPSECQGVGCALGIGIDAASVTVILTVVAGALLLPVLIFIGNATRLSAARREQRFAALRLLGATPRQVAVISSVESCLAAVIGVASGFGLFFAVRPLLARIPFTGERFFTGDLTLGAADVALVAIGIPCGAVVAARLALRRIDVSPLGLVRRATPAPPRPWRLVPLAGGLGWLLCLAFALDLADRAGRSAQAYAYLAGVAAVIVGLVVAGPWLTHLGSQLVARRATRPASLIAGRRLADDPRAGFRAISGVVVAVFVATAASAVITTIVAHDRGTAGDPALMRGTLVSRLGWLPAGERDEGGEPVAGEAIDALRALDGVDGVAVVRAEAASFYAVCAELAAVPAFGRCPPGAATVRLRPDYGGGVGGGPTMADSVWPDAHRAAGDVDALPVATVAVATDGSRAAIERARTVLELADPAVFAPQTLGEANAEPMLDNYRRLADVVILASLPIAGSSLAVNIAGGLADRKRPFGLLRLSGTPVRVLRRVVLLESAVPLALGALGAIVAGLLAALLFLRAQLGYPLEPPGAAYYLMTGAGLAVALAVIASTLPLLARVTAPESVREE